MVNLGREMPRGLADDNALSEYKISSTDETALFRWFNNVLMLGCDQLIDERGQLKSEILNLVPGLESSKASIQETLSSFQQRIWAMCLEKLPASLIKNGTQIAGRIFNNYHKAELNSFLIKAINNKFINPLIVKIISEYLKFPGKRLEKEGAALQSMFEAAETNNVKPSEFLRLIQLKFLTPGGRLYNILETSIKLAEEKYDKYWVAFNTLELKPELKISKP